MVSNPVDKFILEHLGKIKGIQHEVTSSHRGNNGQDVA